MSAGPSRSTRLQPEGDSALLITFGSQVDPEVNQAAHALARMLASHPLAGLGEIVPGYATLLVHYDPLLLTYIQVAETVSRYLSEPVALDLRPRRVEIPVQYGGTDGPDLEFVAQHNQLTPAEVIRMHAGRDYPVFMMGFTPGFPYLGGLNPRIGAPRLATPRACVPAGSVGIAGQQTGIYPLESPGGWRIIGRTTLRLFDPQAEPPCLLAPGDLVRFVPVQPAGQELA